MLINFLVILYFIAPCWASDIVNAVKREIPFGAFRPGLLHGLTSVWSDHVFKTGLLWMKFDNYQDLESLRHECEMNELKYDYIFNDPFKANRQKIVDGNLHIIADLVVENAIYSNLTFTNKSPNGMYSVIYYAYSDQLDATSLGLGALPLDIKINKNPVFQRKVVLNMPESFQPHRIKDVLKNYFNQQLHQNHESQKSIQCLDTFILPNSNLLQGNLLLVQVVFERSLQIEVHIGEKKKLQKEYSKDLALAYGGFVAEFGKAFSLKQRMFSSNFITFAQTTFSNLMGGLGFFGGNAVISGQSRTSLTNDTILTLFSGSPSRPFFPRGFLWDEGFHTLMISQMYPSLGFMIVNNWLNLMDDEGWIMREVILGDEARARVPPEFQMQNPEYANPPVLILPIIATINQLRLNSIFSLPAEVCPAVQNRSFLKGHPSSLLVPLAEMYEKFRMHFRWLMKSQTGTPHKSLHNSTPVYRWRGRSPGHCLTSGLDDYPRGTPSEYELHVDLLSWVGFYAKSLSSLAEFIGRVDDVGEYRQTVESVKQSLELFWHEDAYGDLEYDVESGYKHVVHKGYISLFPFLFGLENANYVPRYYSLLVQLHSVCGIRSLHVNDEFYGKDEDYWRGKVWLNINYLALRSLKLYHWQDQQARKIYHDIRGDIINCVYEVWRKTGYIFEQYDDKKIAGRRSRPFTGWSALIVMIMSEIYD